MPRRPLLDDAEQLLTEARASITRVRKVLDERWLAAPHGDNDHDHLCPDDVRDALRTALDQPKEQ